MIEEPVRLAHGSAGSEASLLHTLSFWFRPLRAGFRMAFGPDSDEQCTLGFLAKIDESGEERVALVNSHCTAVLAASDGGDIYQSTWGTSGHLIGTEARDPAPFACAEDPADGCRNSDAALVRLGASVDWDFPYIARTTGSDPVSGTTTISHSSPRFKVVSEGPVFVGMTVSKIGRVTGWTTGTVLETCTHITPATPPNTLTRLCNGIVQGGAGPGDSGSPVFRELGELKGEPTVALHGLLWGGNTADGVFFFSELPYIREDLGLFTTFEGQSVPSF